MTEIPVGLCQCGCGGLAPLAKMTRRKLGHIKGQPIRFINGHNAVKRPMGTPTPCECGCGGLAPLARLTDTSRGYVRGQPVRFISGHYQRTLIRALDVGERFGRQVVVAEASSDRGRRYLVVCDCGSPARVLYAYSLLAGGSQSCGCVNAERLTTHGMTGTPTYTSWEAAIARCTNPKATGWANYGGRGVIVCARWRHSFEAFLEDMGERPPGTQLGRFGDAGDYEPGNVAWMTRAEQAREQARNRRPRRTAA